MGPAESDAVLFRTSMAPGQLVPLHSHVDPECLYVLSGELEVFVVDEAPGWRPVKAGRSVLLADGVKHAFRNPAAEAADFIVVTNNRLARFFSEAGRPVASDAAFAPPSAEDIERVRRVARDFGYWLASPTESAAITDVDASARG